MSLKKIFRSFASVKGRLMVLKRIKWLKTIYFNFRMFPFRTAIKLPVHFYTNVRIRSLRGRILLNTDIKGGIIKFGLNLELARKSLGISELIIDGTLKVNGAFCTSLDFFLFIQEDAVLEIGEDSHLGSRTRIIVTKRVVLGKQFRLSYESQILDSNLHYMLNTETNQVSRHNGEIIMGDFCWIGNRTTILKDTVTPRFLTVASNSLLNKDYTVEIPEKSVIGGIPARLIKTNYVRIFDFEQETVISSFFNSHPDENVFILKGQA